MPETHRIPVQNESHISTLFTTDLTSSFLHIKLLQLRTKISSYFATLFIIHFILDEQPQNLRNKYRFRLAKRHSVYFCWLHDGTFNYSLKEIKEIPINEFFRYDIEIV